MLNFIAYVYYLIPTTTFLMFTIFSTSSKIIFKQSIKFIELMLIELSKRIHKETLSIL